MGRLLMAWENLISFRFKIPKMPNIFSIRKKVRARNEQGHFLADDPSTPENEAWEEKPKPKGKKRGPYKKRAKKK